MASDPKKLAEEAFIDDDFELAVDLYSKAISLSPKNAQLFAHRAQAYLELNNFIEAIVDTNRAIELDPSLAMAYLCKGTACIKLDDYQTAKIALETGSSLAPGDLMFTSMIIECDKCMSGDDDKKFEEDYSGFSTDEEDEALNVNLDGFKITKVISDEPSVTVYRAINFATNKEVAIKMINIQDQEVTTHMIREMMIKDLKHKNLVSLKSVLLDDDGTKLCLVMEYLPMNLGNYMIIEPLGKTHLKQILEGLSYLHAQGIVHRDLKPENILIDDDTSSGPLVKIADFGLSRAFTSASDGLSPNVGAVGYKAPEILLGSEHYTSAVDIWAVGCIFARSVGKKPLVHKGPDIPTLAEICRILGIPSEETWPGVRELPGYKAISTLNLKPPIGLGAHFPDVESTSFDLLSARNEVGHSWQASVEEWKPTTLCKQWAAISRFVNNHSKKSYKDTPN